MEGKDSTDFTGKGKAGKVMYEFVKGIKLAHSTDKANKLLECEFKYEYDRCIEVKVKENKLWFSKLMKKRERLYKIVL